MERAARNKAGKARTLTPRQAIAGPRRALPMSAREMADHGWDALDILLLSGDAYVDHPSFGVALLGRWLAAHGFRVGIVAQPRWREREAALADITAMGRPRLFAGVTAGAIDSMLAHYTAFRKKRHDDAYTPGGKAGSRPNRACILYTGLVRQAFPGLPVVLGGIEASLRRVSHYDFWTDSLRRSLLLESKADLLVYGMGEYALLDIARTAARLPDETEETEEDKAATGSGVETAPGPARASLSAACRSLRGLAWAAGREEAGQWLQGAAAGGASVLFLPSHEAIEAGPSLLMAATLTMERQVHGGAEHAVQESGGKAVVLNPPAPPLSTPDMDFLYSLPFTRLPHPRYREAIPAWEMIRTSITTHRGCGGGCSFCSLALHQGRRIASRSRDSIVREAGEIASGPEAAWSPEAAEETGADLSRAGTVAVKPEGRAKAPRWAGSVSDVGGPSANMWQAACGLPKGKSCVRPSCLHPSPCPFFAVDQGRGARLLRAIAALPGVRHVRVASGVRFDLALTDPEALHAYTTEFTGGQLKVAPEHSENEVLALMRKPPLEVFERFLDAFARHSREADKEQYTVPYLMSAFPGCTEKHMHGLKNWLAQKRWSPQQVQCFIPTPGTVATAMFYAGIAPDGRAIHVARTDRERLRQHHILLGESPGTRKNGEAPHAGKGGERTASKEAEQPARKSENRTTGRDGQGPLRKGGPKTARTGEGKRFSRRSRY